MLFHGLTYVGVIVCQHRLFLLHGLVIIGGLLLSAISRSMSNIVCFDVMFSCDCAIFGNVNHKLDFVFDFDSFFELSADSGFDERRNV